MFAAWFQLKSFRDDSVRSNSLMQADPTDIAGEHGVPAGDSKAGLAADILLRGATPAMRQKVVRSNENRVLLPSSGNLLQAGQANEICSLVIKSESMFSQELHSAKASLLCNQKIWELSLLRKSGKTAAFTLKSLELNPKNQLS
jgi:hypothetical protein